VLALAGLGGCTPPSDAPDAGIDCREALSPAPPDSTEPEARDDFDARLAAADLDTLPDPLDTAPLGDLDRALLGYAIERPAGSLTTSLAHADVPDTPLGDAALAAFAVGIPGELDSAFLRQAIHRLYACERDVPPTREAFVERYGDYTRSPATQVAMSVPKRGPRAIYEDAAAGVYVADSEVDGGWETEVILADRRADGALDFFAYAPDGALVGWADLAVGSALEPLPLPLTCALCHRDLVENTFSVVDPS
jgi:hypothetical protein